MSAIPVGLRVDVDTFRGTKLGVPALVKLFERYNIKATFFMSVGPDNMGRHLWRLLKPKFLLKMLRSSAASLYGWDIVLAGTCWPGKIIGDHLADVIRLPQAAGHETGLHTWDHYTWQMHVDRFSPEQMEEQLRRGFDKLEEILGEPPVCSAAAGWRCNERALLLKEQFHFRYNSDFRGTHIFMPAMRDGKLTVPQIPVTLPTYDEAIGQNGITDANYNEFILGQIKAGQLNVYTVHAEAEGIGQLANFERLLMLARGRGIAFQPLGALLPENAAALPHCTLKKQPLAGREGWLAQQGA